MKIKWLVIDVTAVQSPDRAELAIYEVILDGRVLANSGGVWDNFVRRESPLES